MESIDPRSVAIAKANLQMSLRREGDSVGLYRGWAEPHQAILTESLKMLGFDVNACREEFEVSQWSCLR